MCASTYVERKSVKETTGSLVVAEKKSWWIINGTERIKY